MEKLVLMLLIKHILTSTDIIGKDDIEVSASDITLDGKHDTIASKQVHEEKQSGLTVSLGWLYCISTDYCTWITT